MRKEEHDKTLVSKARLHTLTTDYYFGHDQVAGWADFDNKIWGLNEYAIAKLAFQGCKSEEHIDLYIELCTETTLHELIHLVAPVLKNHYRYSDNDFANFLMRAGYPALWGLLSIGLNSDIIHFTKSLLMPKYRGRV